MCWGRLNFPRRTTHDRGFLLCYGAELDKNKTGHFFGNKLNSALNSAVVLQV
jgi:hypothetical protein